MRWEYRVFKLGNENGISVEERYLNDLGLLGWELISVTIGRFNTYFYFKRNIKE